MRFSLSVSLFALLLTFFVPSISLAATWTFYLDCEAGLCTESGLEQKVFNSLGVETGVEYWDYIPGQFDPNDVAYVVAIDGGEYADMTAVLKNTDVANELINGGAGGDGTPVKVFDEERVFFPENIPFDSGPKDDPGTWPVPVSIDQQLQDEGYRPGVFADDSQFPGDATDIWMYREIDENGQTVPGSQRYVGTVDGERVELDPETGEPLGGTEAADADSEKVMCEVGEFGGGQSDGGGAGSSDIPGDAPTAPGDNDNCTCTKGGEKQEDGSCECKEGEGRNGDGQCVPDNCNPDTTYMVQVGNFWLWKGPDLAARKTNAKLYENSKVDKKCSCNWWVLNNQGSEDTYEPPHCTEEEENADGTGTGTGTGTGGGGTGGGGGMPGGGGGGMPGGGGGGLPGNLGGLSQMLGGGGGNLLQALGPLISMLGEQLGNQGGGDQQPYDQPTQQTEFPVDQSCLNELRTLERQLEDDDNPTELSNRCMSQLEDLLGADQFATVQDIFDDENNDDDGDNDNNDDKDNNRDKDGVEATACAETKEYNSDCSPKKIVNDDGKVTFGEGDDATTYKKRGDKDVFVDTETGEKFTWEEVLEREEIPEEESESLFDILFADNEDYSEAIAIIGSVFDARAASVIDSIINAANVTNTHNRSSGAAANVFTAIGDALSSVFGGSGGSGSNSPFSAVMDSLGFGNGSSGGPGNFSDFDLDASQFAGTIEKNPNGPVQITGKSLNGVTPKTIALLEYVAERVDHPIHVNSAYRTPEYNATLPGAAPNSQHIYGRALDVSTAGLTETQKVRFAQVILSHPDTNGFGYYSTFYHFDTRPGRNTTWGSAPGLVGSMVRQWVASGN